MSVEKRDEAEAMWRGGPRAIQYLLERLERSDQQNAELNRAACDATRISHHWRDKYINLHGERFEAKVEAIEKHSADIREAAIREAIAQLDCELEMYPSNPALSDRQNEIREYVRTALDIVRCRLQSLLPDRAQSEEGVG